jgi:uncharacterized membrane protein YfcA
VAGQVPHDRPDDNRPLVPYQSIRHAPQPRRLAAVITGATGVMSLCMGAGFGVITVMSMLNGAFGIASVVAAVLGGVFITCSIILFRQANALWGWV